MTRDQRLLLKHLISEVENSDLENESKKEILNALEKNFKESTPSEKQLALSEILKVVSKKENFEDTTDLHLLVSAPTEGIVETWSRERITDALIKEANLFKEEAEEIAFSVERKVFSSGTKIITVDLIRELVDNELFVRGYQKKLQRQKVLGMSTYNLNQLILSQTSENSNIKANNPEAVNLTIAETVLKQYALKEIFSPEVSQAHLRASIHLHDLGYPVRVYCSAHSLEYIKKYGLDLDSLSTKSGPAKHAWTLTGHLNTFLASMQAYYAGALGIGYVNIFYAPYLVGAEYDAIKQNAQYLIFSCSQNAFSRGGQTLFIDFNIHLGIPGYLKEVPAVGPGGKYMVWRPRQAYNGSIDELSMEEISKFGEIDYVKEVPRDSQENAIDPEDGFILRYKHFEKEAQVFAKALMDVWREGDANGRVFPFPKFDLHVNQEVFENSTQYELFKYACQIAAENGVPYFIFDRDEVNLSMCCRLRTKVEDTYMIKHPESMRFCGFQNVTINLPQAAYRAKKPKDGNIEKYTSSTVEEVLSSMELAAKAHLEKKNFIARLMEKPGLPLWQVGRKGKDGRPYIDLEKSTYIIGLIGLNEAVKHITGQALHESHQAYKVGLKIVSAMYLKVKELEKEHKLKFTLEETPAESTTLRFAKIDLQNFPEAKKYVRGNIEKGEVYYTNSVHIESDAPVDIITRIEMQGKFNTLIESGAITHVFLGEERPTAESIEALVERTWRLTQSAQITISPEFTFCEDCGKVTPGYGRGISYDKPHNHFDEKSDILELLE